jgi:hypothetical protein
MCQRLQDQDRYARTAHEHEPDRVGPKSVCFAPAATATGTTTTSAQAIPAARDCAATAIGVARVSTPRS